MKKLLTLLILVLLGCVLAFGQCQFPQLGIGQGLHAVDSATIQESHTRCTPCHTEGVVSWDLVGDVDWQIFINSNDTETVTIQITKDCSMLLFDTCVSLPPPFMPAVWSFSMQFSVYENAQIHVSGKVGQVIYADVKGTPTAHEQLDDVLLDLNTCGLPTAINEPIKPIKATYFDAKTLQKVVTLEPYKAYIVRYGIQ